MPSNLLTDRYNMSGTSAIGPAQRWYDDPNTLYDIIEASEKIRDSVINASRRMVMEYAGSYHRIDKGPEEPVPENIYKQWLDSTKPKIVYDNPKVVVTNNRSGMHRHVSKAMQGALNWWAPQVRYNAMLKRLFDDAAFSYGVFMTNWEPMPDYRHLLGKERIPFIPIPRRISPSRWFCDYQCEMYTPLDGNVRLAGHVTRKAKYQLMEDSTYHADVVQEIAADMGTEKWTKEPSRQVSLFRNPGAHGSDGDIYLYEVWVPEKRMTDDPRAHGSILTLAVAMSHSGERTKPRWIRDPYPFMGPPWGPYTMIGYNYIDEIPYPLSPFAAHYEQIQEHNAHREAAALAASNYKRFIAVNSGNRAGGEAIMEAEHGGVTMVPNLNKDTVQNLETGGVHENVYRYLNLIDQAMERSLGRSQTSQNVGKHDPTATEVASGDAVQSTREAVLKDGFEGATVEGFGAAAWFMYHEEDAAYAMPPEVASSFVPRPPGLPPENLAGQIALERGLPLQTVQDALHWNPKVIFAGGPAKNVIAEARVPGDDEPTYVISSNTRGTRFSDLGLEISPMSMGKQDAALQQRNALLIGSEIIKAAPMMVQYPHVNWEEWLNMIGDSLNMRDLAERILNLPFLEQLRLQQQGGAQPQQGAPELQIPGIPQQGQQPVRPAVRQPSESMGSAQQIGQLNGFASAV